jgi:hypothetical protein
LSPAIAAAIVVGLLLIAVVLGKLIARRIPGYQLSADTRDTVKLATGLVATMAALLLGLLISSAKNGHDARRGQVIQMAAKIMLLDRVLARYGPEATDARTKLRAAVEEMMTQVWSGGRGQRAEVRFGQGAGDATYIAIESLDPPVGDETEHLREVALARAIEIAELRVLLLAHSIPTISLPILSWWSSGSSRSS